MENKVKIKKVIFFTIVAVIVMFSLFIAITHTEGYGVYIELPKATLISPDGMDVNAGCALDFCNDIPVSNDAVSLKNALSVSADSYVISGWAVDIRNNNSLDSVYIKVGNKVVRCEYGFQRDDIAEVFDSEECRKTGFKVEIPSKMVKRFDGSLVDSISFYLLCKSTEDMVGPITYKMN